MLKSTLFAIVIAFALSSCSSSKATAPVADQERVQTLLKTREELINKGIPTAFVTTTSQDLQKAINMAELEARAQIARIIQDKTNDLQKGFSDQTNEDLTQHFMEAKKSIAFQTLSGSALNKIEFSQNNGLYRVYALMILDPKLFKDALDAQFKSAESAKVRWMASKGYQELDKEIAAFEAYQLGE